MLLLLLLREHSNPELSHSQAGENLHTGTLWTVRGLSHWRTAHLKSCEADKLGIVVVLDISSSSGSGISPRDQDGSRLGEQGAAHA